MIEGFKWILFFILMTISLPFLIIWAILTSMIEAYRAFNGN